MTEADMAAATADGPTRDNWRECPQCGLVTALPPRLPALAADCPRCGHTLWRDRGDNFELPLACCLAALCLYVFALLAPFLEISAYGRFQLARLATGPIQLSLQGFELVGLLVLLVSIVLPGVKLGILLTTLFGIESRLLPRRVLVWLFSRYARITPWAMIDVYLLGFLVAYTRLAAIAAVHLDTALFALVGFMVVSAAADGALDPEAVWRALDDEPGPAGAAASLIGCQVCGLLNQAVDADACRRCHSVLRRRKPGSIASAWALLCAAALLYIPANIYPVMLITQLAQAQNYTIMGGILELTDYGLWPLAILVFFASITIPLLKLLTLAYLLVQTQRGSDEHLIGRARAYRLIEFIGRWSMIDVFVISILVALVRFGQFANIQAELGAPCFAGVVVLTMFAAKAFDPRLMWDAVPAATAPKALPA
jgi:paraquat-inducible protein A